MTGNAPAPPGDTEVLAACAFAAVPGIGASTLSRIAAVHGSLELALAAGPAALLSRATELRLRAATVQYLEEEPDLVRLGTWALEEARKAGAHPLLPGREGYPALLARAPNPPALLYVRGKLAAEAKRVAIVGSRDSDELGLRMARALAEGLARAGVEVVSGGARGVDAAAHAGALWGEGSTVAVLGCGIDQAYPAENRDLFDRIAAGSGAVVSELVPGSPPARPNFPRRNRIIAGLSHATVVVRAGSRSGALVTARDAFAAGRQVRGPRPGRGCPLRRHRPPPSRRSGPRSGGCRKRVRTARVESAVRATSTRTFVPDARTPAARPGGRTGKALASPPERTYTRPHRRACREVPSSAPGGAAEVDRAGNTGPVQAKTWEILRALLGSCEPDRACRASTATPRRR